MKSKINQVFYAALTARIISIFCLGVFYYALQADLTDRVAIMALGLSFTAWLVGSFFIGVYKDGITRMTLAVLAADSEQQEEAVAAEEDDDDKDEYPRHPMFDE
jgi:hypothetical protein